METPEGKAMMGDLTGRFTRVEDNLNDLTVQQRVNNEAFTRHETANKESFTHVENKVEDKYDMTQEKIAELKSEVTEIRRDIAELKAFMYRAGGALLVLGPLVNWLASKFF